MFDRCAIFSEHELPDAGELISQGRKLAEVWRVGPCPFLREHGVASEAEFKQRAIAERTVMQHAQIGWRDQAKSQRAWAEIHQACEHRGIHLVRYGICLDWSMGLPRDQRSKTMRGTGLLLNCPEDFSALTAVAPVAPHFGDFVLGFPAAFENTCGALAAGATSIGNLGQYFTFRLHGPADDVTCTAETLKALALIATQPVPVLVHSNLDDGFAALFQDLGSVLGAALLERHIGALLGVEISHCWGHHFSNPVRRLAFHLALAQVSGETPGTMIYGNTTSYRGTAEQNYTSLAAYLSVDIAGQMHCPTGHAVNPVPVTENERIPDVEEVVDAQVFCAKQIEKALDQPLAGDMAPALSQADAIVSGAQGFAQRVLKGFTEAGIDTQNPFEMLLAIRRMGGRRLEAFYGRPSPATRSDIAEEVAEMADHHLARVPKAQRTALAKVPVRVVTATTDVHEHGKLVLDKVLENAGVTIIDGGTNADPRALARLALEAQADAVAISTYNGVALRYFNALRDLLDNSIPVLIGGRLNQIPEASNSSLPVDVGDELKSAGAIVCRQIEDAVPALLQHMETKQ